MDCIEAQSVVSQALDKAPVDEAVLETAKRHCTTCAECTSFVRAVAATLRTPLPQPDETLPDRIMAVVRAEAAKPASGPTAPNPVATKPGESSSTSAPSDTERLLKALRDPRHRRALAGWASAAAVMLIVAGAFAGQGVRQILVPSADRSMTTMGGIPEGGVVQGDSIELYDTAPQQDTSASGQDEARTLSAPSAVATENYISFGGAAYRLVADSAATDPSSLSQIGTARSSLGQPGAPSQLNVLGNREDLSRIHIAPVTGELLTFELVTRVYGGRTFALQTAEITEFGQWPSLPRSMSKPTSDDGAPVFRLVETESSGALVYEPRAGGSGVGIAIGPGSPESDPARGNPEWTWWTPIR